MVNDEIRKSFGGRVREIRISTGLSQEAFAEHCKLDRSYMSKIETGKANLTLDSLKDIADAFDMTLSQLFKDI
jgi:transcriptional regulator with XRE-family HTH domain